MMKKRIKKGFIISGMLLLIAFAGFAIEGLYFDDKGNVGIGTATPEARLDVKGTIQSTSNTGVGLINAKGPGDTWTYAGIYLTADLATDKSWCISHRKDFANDLNFSFYSGIGQWQNHMIITDTGNVGIGTTSPKAKFSVSLGNSDMLNIYQPADNRLAIQTTLDNQGLGTYGGSNNRLLLQPITGLVGIGTMTPNNIFVVKTGGDNDIFEVRSDGNVGVELRSGSTGGTPYIDFSNDNASDYDTRLILRGDNKLSLEGGNLGIGTSNPQQKLVIAANFDEGKQSESQLSHSHPVAIVGNAPGIDFINTIPGVDDWAIHVGYQEPGEPSNMFFMTGGWRTVFRLYNSGKAELQGGLHQFSDIRYKNEISTIPNALDKITQLRGVNFKWKDMEDKNLQMGVIAQDVEKVFPELVSTNHDGYKTVAYANLVGALIEAIKEQQTQIDELKGIEPQKEKNLWDKLTGIFN